MSLRPDNYPSRHGFSLVELMVAITLLTLLATMLLGIVESATRLWRQSESRVDGFREARAAAHVIRRDLEGIPPNAPQTWFQYQAVTNGDARADRLFFVTALPQGSQTAEDKSDLCVVGYFLDWTPPETSPSSHKPGTYNLYRYLLRSNDTFTNHVAASDPLETDVSSASSGVEVLARNIQSFALDRFLHQTNSGSLVPVDGSTSHLTPDVLEVRMTALNDDAARRLPTRSSWHETPPAHVRAVSVPVRSHISITPGS